MVVGAFNFKKLDKDIILLTNDIGRHCFLNEQEFNLFLAEELEKDSRTYKYLEENYFIISEDRYKYIGEVANSLRSAKSYLFSATELHIFVVTNYCNSGCIYCQAQSNSLNTSKAMDLETARKSVEIALQSPYGRLSFEFQGGEPLSNFEIIKYIVEYTEMRKNEKIIEYNVVSNLALLTEEMADFFKEYNVSISTSLDGNRDIQCKNRPLISGQDSFKILEEKAALLSCRSMKFGAIQTTTKYSINKHREIIDAYILMDLNEVFIRPLTPLGVALKKWDEIGYTTDEFIEFYSLCLEYILKLNKEGIEVREGHAKIFLNKIINGFGMNYMELRSPCGASIGQIAYYYDGKIFTCDEGRMVYEMGDDAFCLGNVFTDNYDKLMNSKICRLACKYSILESLPKCFECVYQSFCGVCPVINYALEKDVVTKKYNNYRCRIYAGMLDKMFILLKDEDNREVFERWLK